MPPQRDNVLAMVGKYVSLAMVLPTAAFTGYVIGYFLDKAFGTKFLAVVFLLLGIVGGLIEVLRTLLKDSAKEL